jgi:tetratricopeptide (TPR) repeat protein
MLGNCRAKLWVRGTFLIILMLVSHGCSGDTQAKKRAHFQKGEMYLAEERYAEAIIEFKNTVQLDPKDAQAHYKLGLAYLKKGGLPNLQEAFQEIKKSVNLDPNSLQAQLKLGEFYLLSKRFNEAQEKAEHVLQRESNSVDAHILLGNAYAGQQNLASAIEALQTALRLDHPLSDD